MGFGFGWMGWVEWVEWGMGWERERKEWEGGGGREYEYG